MPFFRNGDGWPASSSFELRIVGEGGAPTGAHRWREPPGADGVRPKAAMVEVQLASTFEASDLGVLGSMGVVQKRGIATPALEKSALDGLVWLLTPPRSVVLVHAVRQPLQAPEFSPRFSIERNPNTTTADPDPIRPCRSTGPARSKIDIGASWDEWVDNGQNANPDKPAPTAACG